MSIMQVNGYLIIKEDGALRVTKRRPALDADEIAAALTVRVPRDYFKRPALSLSVDLPAAGDLQELLPCDIGPVGESDDG